MVIQLYSTEMMKYIGYVEVAIGLGLGLGPSLGSIVYTYVGYEQTMYFFGGLDLFGALCCIFMIPSILNQTVSQMQYN